eukprot:1334395-Alexandrium_andersonii.AAC.1
MLRLNRRPGAGRWPGSSNDKVPNAKFAIRSMMPVSAALRLNPQSDHSKTRLAPEVHKMSP